jgi:amino acid adenylation domain-containing protein
LLAEVERAARLSAGDEVDMGDSQNKAIMSMGLAGQPAAIRPEKRNPTAVFLLSSPRSGSTLLRVMLAGHPDLFCPPELHLLPFNSMAEREAKLAHSYLGEGLQRAIMELMDLDAAESKAVLADWVAQDLSIHEVYGRLQELARPRLLVDKSPSYASDLGILERAEALFDDARYIHLIRHPYAAIDSFARHRMDKMFDSAGADPLKLAEQVWATSNSNTLDFLEEIDPERHCQIRYEDLVTNPEAVMADLCAFLSIPFTPEVLTPYQGERMTDGVHAQSRAIGDPDFLKHTGIQPDLADAWRRVSLPRRLSGVTRRVADALGYELPWPPAPAQVEKKQPGGAPPIVPVDRTENLALSFPQFRLLFLDQFEPGLATYNIPMALRLHGSVDTDALRRALREILRRHEALRTNFIMVEGQPYQTIAPLSAFDLPLISLEHLPEAEREAEMERLARAEVRRPFDLARDYKLHVALIRLDARDHVLVMTMHHIASDGWSLGVFLRELATLYEAFIAGRPAPLAELPVQYADFAQWQRQWLRGERLDKHLAYWREQLGHNPPVLELPLDRPRPAMQSFNGRRLPLALPAELTAALKALSRQEGVTLYMTLLAAFQTLLYRYTGQEDIAVGSPISGRDRPEIKGLIGFFVNTLVMRTDLSGEPTFRELLARVRQTTLAAYDHQDVPFEKLVEEFWPSRNLSHSPLFQVMFILQNAPASDLTLPGLRVTPLEVDTGTAKFDMNLSLTDTPEGLRGWLEYNTDLFEPATIERVVRHFRHLLEAAVADPEQTIVDLPLMGQAEQQALLAAWNDTARPYPQDGRIHQLFEAQAAKTPDAVALVFEGAQLTYAELDQRANQLAHLLQSLGVGPEVIVGVAMERSPEMVIAVYGILKAGGAYVPLEPTLPAERLAFMLTDTQAPIVLTQETVQPKLLPTAAHVICLDSDWADVASYPTFAPDCPATESNLAYVIYTSGSTGKPKGVMNEHRGVRNRLLWGQEQYPLTADDCHVQKTPFGFDVSVPELFWPLMVGARLVIARPEGHKDASYLANLIEQERVTTIHFVPSMLQQFVESTAPQGCRSLKRVFCSGEALALDLQDRFFEKFDAELYNLYGPTEAAVEVSYWQCLKDSALRSVPIGRPIANTQLYILDKKMRPAPVGLAGELHIGGANVARGYLNRPDLTAEKFIPDPFTDKPGARLYKTGDLARFLPDGNIEYLGRIDFQVKVRGFRIEPGEIETILTQHAAVRESVVVVREDVPGDKRLVAYLVTSPERPPTVTELRQFLKQKLPDYMIPTAFVFLETLPLTASGKTNRQALPAPDGIRPALSGEFVAPRTALETQLAGIWARLLRVERVGLHDNFFELGGHSLLAAQLTAAIETDLGVIISLRTLFEAPTVAELASLIDRRQNGSEKDGIEGGLSTPRKLTEEEIKQTIDLLFGGSYE